MAWMVKDFVCSDCGAEFEELYKKGEEGEIVCPSCGSSNTSIDGISSPALGIYSMQDQAGKNAILKKRSAEHTKKEVLKNADRFGAGGLARRKEYLGK